MNKIENGIAGAGGGGVLVVDGSSLVLSITPNDIFNQDNTLKILPILTNYGADTDELLFPQYAYFDDEENCYFLVFRDSGTFSATTRTDYFVPEGQ